MTIRTGHAITAAVCCLLPLAAAADTLQVGPGQTYATPCAAIAAAGAGDTILIDAAGSYDGDVCAWSTNGLTLRGVNGRPHIDAAGNDAQGKAIWVISGDDTTIDNVELSGCRVPDANGAGIRQQGANLTVRNAFFHDNENGILAGERAGSTITIEHSEFANNGAGDGQSHNLYIGHVDRLVFRYNWSHHAVVGHLLKSRAAENVIEYNRLTGEAGGSESYEINLPNGGLSYVIGNLIQQPSTTQNGAMLDYLSEGFGQNTDDRLFVVNNTFVNGRGSGTFLQIGTAASTPVIARNNIFHGGGTPSSQASAVLDHNVVSNDALFVDATNYDYRLLPTATAVIDAGVDPGSGAGRSLQPTRVYVHPVADSGRPVVGAIDVGAYEWTGDVIFRDGFDGEG
ncbi:right-handed parallel beta-helix repeat-containing protein [Dokdonella sp.]|uniref:right-handed parallel beta-helix repeat-containing protein n=1 Tax=Dokdonella sp. TaxID=2291710 RepID=UPI001B172090|nr:right-handed parallel beta-helix repeat-containing protein [Dokdonella sp.]MBO9662249.1 right-handed parallel beta-helix repeat-containing protein [Dokdonella sp.]